MATTYEPIATYTLSTTQATVTFLSIPSTYTDLVLACSAQVSSASGLLMEFNNDTATNYSSTMIYTDGASTPGSGRYTNQSNIIYNAMNGIGITGSGVYTPIIINIQNYSNATTYKTVLGTQKTPKGGYLGNSDITNWVGLWRKSPEAITSIKVFPSGGHNFTSGSTFTLYGIKAA